MRRVMPNTRCFFEAGAENFKRGRVHVRLLRRITNGEKRNTEFHLAIPPELHRQQLNQPASRRSCWLDQVDHFKFITAGIPFIWSSIESRRWAPEGREGGGVGGFGVVTNTTLAVN